MTSRSNKTVKLEVRYDCGCGVGENGAPYCCRRHYDLVKLLHTEKTEYDPPLPPEEEGECQ